MDYIIIAERISLALLLGCIIGFERQWRKRNAGLRTNTLVSIGSCLYILISVNIAVDDASPSRIASQVVTGIGFLGAGVIMKEGFNVRGLNTAATLWCSAAVGSLIGFGYWKEAFIGTLAVIITHVVLRPLGAIIEKRPVSRGIGEEIYLIKIICEKKYDISLRAILINLIADKPLHIYALKSYDEKKNLTEIAASLVSLGRNDTAVEGLVSKISLEKGVYSITWELEHRDSLED
jgi:putative Mg2+ transporter-C (MgtC) family protein